MNEILKNSGRKIYNLDGQIGSKLNRKQFIKLMTKLKVKLYKNIFEDDLGPDYFVFNFLKMEVYLIEDRTDVLNDRNEIDLTNCDFNIKFYNKILLIFNFKVFYRYILDGKSKKIFNTDILSYMSDSGCDYQFDVIYHYELFGIPKEEFLFETPS
jgi:hypothetical protein